MQLSTGKPFLLCTYILSGGVLVSTTNSRFRFDSLRSYEYLRFMVCENGMSNTKHVAQHKSFPSGLVAGRKNNVRAEGQRMYACSCSLNNGKAIGRFYIFVIFRAWIFARCQRLVAKPHQRWILCKYVRRMELYNELERPFPVPQSVYSAFYSPDPLSSPSLPMTID